MDAQIVIQRWTLPLLSSYTKSYPDFRYRSYSHVLVIQWCVPSSTHGIETTLLSMLTTALLQNSIAKPWSILINIRILGNITPSDLLQKFIFKTSHARSPTRCNAAPTWLPTMQNRLCRIVMLVNLKRNKHRCGKAQLVKYQSVYLSRRLLQQSYEYPTAACSMGPSAIPFLSISPGLPYTILEFSTKLLTACEAHWNQLYDSSIPIPSCKSQCWRYAFSPKARRGTRGPSLHHPILWIVVFRIPCLCRLFHAQSSESRLYQSCCIRWWRCKHLCHLSVLARQSTSYLHLLCMHWHGSRYG